MPLDNQSAAVLELFNKMGADQAYKLPLAVFRAGAKHVGTADLSTERQGLASVEDRNVPGPGGLIPVRIYRAAPATGEVASLLIYFHGGGFVVGDLDSCDGLCCQLTKQSGCVTISVDYRLAPEHPFPAAMDDAEAALRWAVAHANELGVDPGRVVVGGDSAGAHIATVVAQRVKRGSGPAIALQLLAYPPTDVSGQLAKRTKNAEGYFLTKGVMDWFNDQFVPNVADRCHAEASPLLARELGGLPPALVLTAEFDPLCEEGEHYADRMREAGVKVILHRYEGTIHGFLAMYPMIPKGAEAVAEFAAAIRALSI